MKALNDNAHPLESLLQQHCPNGVEFKELKEVCKLQAGDRIIKSMMNDKAKYPVMGGGTEPTGYYHDYNFNQAITIARAGSAGYVAWQEGKFWATDVCFVAILPISHCEGAERPKQSIKSAQVDCHDFANAKSRNDKVILKFVFYVLKANEYELKKHLYGGSMPKLDKNYLWNFPIPLPPLEIQYKIVEILDAFTELEAELEARLKQYHYYRNKLLSFEELEKRANAIGGGLKLVSLGELGKISMCKRILKNQTKSSGDIPFYKIGTFGGVADSFIDSSIFNEFKEKFSYPQKGDILISASGTIGKAVIYQGENAYYQDSNIVWLKHDGTKLNNKFLFYCYQNTQWDKYVSKGGTITRLYNDNLRKVKIPLPPLEVQNDIVELLDKFDTLTNDLTSGIPAEIEARKKQYEYYRERLLNFIAKD
ncbi:restriction endonuclease subunit S [Campylobacter upsaliensis]|nr:restriction endonuclease subunit S [Campylobacter upsaliensis]